MCTATCIQYCRFQLLGSIIVIRSLWNTEIDNLETTEGAELSRSRRAATAEDLSRTTSTEIITLASNISADQLQTGNFGFQHTIYFATWIPSSADIQSTLWFIDDIALINSSSTLFTTHAPELHMTAVLLV